MVLVLKEVLIVMSDAPQFTCPLCVSTAITIEHTCPGYMNQSGRVMVCHPYCGNAQEYRCSCGWWYRYPVGSRSTQGMGVAPDWIEAAYYYFNPTLDESDQDYE
jgi:hypothetical protein